MLKQETQIVCNHENSSGNIFGQHYNGLLRGPFTYSTFHDVNGKGKQEIYISTEKLDENLNWHLICNFQAPRNHIKKLSTACTSFVRS